VAVGDLPQRLFVCGEDEAELRRRGHRGALAWIERGREMRNRRGEPIFEVLPGRPWYRLQPRRHRILFTKALHDTHLHRLFDEPAAIDQRLYGVDPPAGLGPVLVAAVLNSALTALSAEVVGSTSLGEGALDLPVRTVRHRLLVPDARRFDAAAAALVRQAFEALASRPVGPVWQEIRREDRRALDRAVLAALGLDPARWLDPVYDALTAGVRERIDLAASRRRRRRAAP
jgi:hypothetical protein